MALPITLFLIEEALLFVAQRLKRLGLIGVAWNGPRRAIFDHTLGLAGDAGLFLRAIRDRLAAAGGVRFMGSGCAVRFARFAVSLLLDAMPNAVELDAAFRRGRIEDGAAGRLRLFGRVARRGGAGGMVRFGDVRLRLVDSRAPGLTLRLVLRPKSLGCDSVSQDL